MTTIKNVQVPSGCHMVSFDVKSLFTKVPLEYTIGLVLERIYNKGELVTNTARSERNYCCYPRKMFISAKIRISTYRKTVLLCVTLYACACRDIYGELRKVVSP